MIIDFLLLVVGIAIAALLIYGWRQKVASNQSSRNRYCRYQSKSRESGYREEPQANERVSDPESNSNYLQQLLNKSSSAGKFTKKNTKKSKRKMPEVSMHSNKSVDSNEGTGSDYSDDPDIVLGLKQPQQPASSSQKDSNQQDNSLTNEPTNQSEKEKKDTTTHEVQSKKQMKKLFFYLKSPKGIAYNGYELLQALLACDLRYGEMDLFHCYQKIDPNQAVGQESAQANKVLFSVAAATSEGTFDLSNMGNFSCPGLVFFMNPAKLAEPATAFESMINTIKQLSEDLGGQLLDGQQKTITDEQLAEIKQQLNHFTYQRKTVDMFD